MMQATADARHSADGKVHYVSPTAVLVTYSDQESASLLHDHFHKSLHKHTAQPGTNCERDFFVQRFANLRLVSIANYK